MVLKEIVIPCAIIKLRNDGILHIHVTIKDEIEIEHTKAIFEARNNLTENKSYKHLYTGGIYLNPSDEVKKFAASALRNENVIADAYVISSLSQRLMGNFYIKLNKPKRPTKLFTDPDKATEWLNNFK